MSWKDNIAAMVLVKQDLMKQDVKYLWSHHFPEVGANENDILAVEKELRYKLDPIFRDFLKYANGWKGFYQTVKLFGTEQLKGSTIMDYAQVNFG